MCNSLLRVIRLCIHTGYTAVRSLIYRITTRAAAENVTDQPGPTFLPICYLPQHTPLLFFYVGSL